MEGGERETFDITSGELNESRLKRVTKGKNYKFVCVGRSESVEEN